MNMYHMFHQGMAVNHNIVEVHGEDFAVHLLQDPVYHAPELAGCIRQATRQNLPLVQTKISAEGWLLPVVSCDTNLVVTRYKVQLCETAGAVYGVERVVDMFQRITILDSCGIYCARIYAHTQHTVRLSHE